MRKTFAAGHDDQDGLSRLTRLRARLGDAVGAARPSPRAIALAISAAAVLAVLAATYAALWTPGSLDLTLARDATGRERVSWVALDGPSVATGVRAGDVVVGRRLGGRGGPVLLVRSGGRTLVLGPDVMAPGVPDLLDTGLGLWLLLLGALVLARASDRRAGRAFWATCLMAGLALGLAAAAAHGLRPALIAQFAALRLAGPAFLALALAFPTDASPRGGARKGRGRALAWIWLPALAVLPAYLPIEWRPDAFAAPGRALVDVVLLGYIVAACARVAALALRPARRQALSAAGRGQLTLLALGSVGGFAPFLALSLGPRLVAGAEVAPSQVTILALALLPLCVSVAVVQTEFLGITALVHRRTLRLLLGLALLGLVSGLAWAFAAAGQRAGWPAAPVAAVVAIGAALGVGPTWRAASRAAERLFLRDVYDTGAALLGLSVDLDAADPRALGALSVARLGHLLDLSLALLVDERDEIHRYVHPRAAPSDALLAGIARRARVLRDRPPLAEVSVERVAGLPILFVPACDGEALCAILALGPKRGGDRYTAEDRRLLAALARHLATLLTNARLQDVAARRLAALERNAVALKAAAAALERTAAERAALARRLHNDAIQVGHEVIRRLGDLRALPAVAGVPREALAGAEALATDLVARLRAVVADLYPAPLEFVGLAPALEILLRHAERAGGLSCVLDSDPTLRAGVLTPAQEEALYEIVAQAVGNTLRHAAAETIRVSLWREGAGLRLRVVDDGRGFAPRPSAALVEEGHIGLALLREHARALGGELEVTTAPGRGTAIEVWAPDAWRAAGAADGARAGCDDGE